MKIALKNLICDASNGYATLPFLEPYREDIGGECIDVEDKHIMTCLRSRVTKRLFIFNPLQEEYLKYPTYKTLNRKGLDFYFKMLWNTFDQYQQNNESKYWVDKKNIKVKLTEQNFHDLIYAQITEIEGHTLKKMYVYENRIKVMKKICEEHNLNYEEYKNKKDSYKEKFEI